MDEEERGLLRLLASWHAARHELDLVLAPLFAHGPAASARVTSRLDDVEALLDQERRAFSAYAAAARARADRVPTRLLPAAVDGPQLRVVRG